MNRSRRSDDPAPAAGGRATDSSPAAAGVDGRLSLDEAAVIGLGANLEEPLAQLRQALRLLAEAPGLELATVSSVYLTEPQGGPAGQNWYHNAVAFFHCRLEAGALLELLLSVEQALGRRRLERWGPRIIDLDLLALGRTVVNEPPELIVPHPRLGERLFVLAPLAEAAPGWIHPVSGLTAGQMLASLAGAGQGLKRTDLELWKRTKRRLAPTEAG